MPGYPWDLLILIAIQLAIGGFLSWMHELLPHDNDESPRTRGQILVERTLWALWLTILHAIMYLCIMVIGPSWLPGKITSPEISESVKFATGVIFIFLVIFLTRRHLGSETYLPSEIRWTLVLLALHQGGYASFMKMLDILSSKS